MNLSLAIPMLIAAPILLICGFMLKKYPPQKINMWYGYRTSLSRKNSDTWAIANAYCANLFMLGGCILTALGLISLVLPDMGVSGTYIGQGILFGFIALLVAATEKHLNKLFDKNGNRKV